MIRGFPFWLREVPGIVFRTDNVPFKVSLLIIELDFNHEDIFFMSKKKKNSGI